MKCANDIWVTKDNELAPSCKAGYMTCDPMVCNHYRVLNEDGRPRVYSVWDLFQLIADKDIEIKCYYLQPKQVYVFILSKRTDEKQAVITTEIPLSISKQVFSTPATIERAILNAMDELERRLQE